MRIPRYWARASADARTPRGTPFPISLWRASEHSVAEAERLARGAVQRMAERVRAGDPLPRSYGYPDRPLREELVQELRGPSGDVHAIVTRNSYGALVLNTTALMFIDVDVPEEPWGEGLWRRAMAALGRPAPSPREETEARVRAWGREHAALGVRLYQTAAGFRLAVTRRLVEPGGAESLRLLESAGADPLYVRLCGAQACYRARLSPKPWRCGLPAPPRPFPWASEAAEAEGRRWQRHYEREASAYATCRLLEAFGPAEPAPEVAPLLRLHDRLCRAEDALPLA